jgi:uncharacterized protein YbjT (DUF2867 family)
MILVVGSTGLLGSEICRRLRARGKRVRALARRTADRARLKTLESSGCEIAWGDLKDAASLARACMGVEAVISTASSTFSRQEGDSIESVDRLGQIALVQAAKAAGVQHFTFFGLMKQYGDSPLIDAKLAFEEAVVTSGMLWTNLVGNFFMEVWLSPPLGFDYVNHKAVIYGDGRNSNSWVSYRDIAEVAVRAHETDRARNKRFMAGGPEALSPLEVVKIFEQASGRTFQVEHIATDVLQKQFESAVDPLAKTFAGLQLAYARGAKMNIGDTLEVFPMQLTSVGDYARTVTRA